MIKRYFYTISIILSGLIISSCDSSRVYEEYRAIDDHNWNYSDSLVFKADVKYTERPYDVFISLRHTGDYKYSNIWVSLITISPNNNRESVRNEFKLADKEGNWLGSGLGDIIDHRFIVKQGIKFKKEGEYTFIVKHQMREDELDGIVDVGFRLSLAE